jgi:hypothetical protein
MFNTIRISTKTQSPAIYSKELVSTVVYNTILGMRTENAIAQVVSSRLPTVEAQVQAK